MEQKKIAVKTEKQIKKNFDYTEHKFLAKIDTEFQAITREENEISLSNISFAKSELKSFLEKTKPLKQAIDDLKKPILEAEKNATERQEKIIKFWENKNQEFKRLQLERQLLRNQWKNFVAELEMKLNYSENRLKIQAQENIDYFNNIVNSFENNESIEEIKPVEIVEEIPEYEDKNFNQAKKIEIEYEYFIEDEKLFIEYCLENKLLFMLDIKSKLREFNSWIKTQERKDFYFIGKREFLK
jgi:seryl-tRNA synthetase